ncbi:MULTISPECIES: roadblock/LC7 domain-containing protein [Streptomyces]|uniref:Roadblock/LC7 domain-containing protein n=1 Tax=Streptomyces koyangensis TaxID=188770 RepID=A0A385DC03_9ACTN|nr:MULTISPECIES: roadblock/LC7 domain-containing protein [Streptomyces]KIX77134.1 dynein regulation protein LC7 [Streptomyces sp. MBRL 601]WTD04553.1 roadblock/LC7 domain-containing protein [Streptomyces albidoflavus]AXQ55520.1 roadblock/LC7 domain-containing protein [Streptomyces koyangensis]PKR44653.1 dynein regulation protein LC7 [Streptomyces sp. EAG2]QRF03873.1 roadblock/LC7 domain-containing protein [Streptomyces koyangensis]
MKTDLSWVLNDVLEVRGARHAILVSGDGLLLQSSDGIERGEAETNAAAMSSMQSLSRAVAGFVGLGRGVWKQTLMEYDGGWIFLIAAGQGAYLAVSADVDVDMESMSIRMQKTVAALSRAMGVAPRSNNGVSV